MEQKPTLEQLKQKVDTTRKAFEKSVRAVPFNVDALMQARKEYDDAQAELEAFLDANKSPEELAAEKAYKEAEAEYEKTATLLKEKKEAYELVLKAVGKTLTAPRAEGDHSRKLEYADAQEIRKMIAEGVSNKDIKAKYGNSDSSINYVKNYLQHKLKPGDTAHTPLINPFYPFGAPLVGEKYKELPDKERFKVKTFGEAEIRADIKAKVKPADMAAKYGTSERAINDYIAALPKK
jgi:tetratricopeptide (TPR) repeat protein